MIRYRHDPEAENDLSDYIDQRFDLARSEGARAERHRTQPVMIGMAATATVSVLLNIFQWVSR